MKNNKVIPPDSKYAKWHGLPREEIPWFPVVDESKCIGCKLCYVSCGRNVYDFDEKTYKSVVAKPFNCLVGCSTCAIICPSDAISFPPREIIHQIEKEYRIIGKIQNTARVKKAKQEIEKLRHMALDSLENATVAIQYEVVGHVLEKQIGRKIHEFLKNRPLDCVDFTINTASLSGCWDMQSPSLLKFKIISTEYKDISEFEKDFERIFIESGLIITQKTAVRG